MTTRWATEADISEMFKAKWLRLALAGVALVGVYAAVGFGLAPNLLRAQAVDFVKKTYGRELQIGTVRLNPFLLQLEVQDVGLPDKDGQEMLSLKRLFVDFEFSSLWRQAFVFRDVVVETPGVRAVRRADGTLNLADLAPPAREVPQPEPPELPRVWIESLAVTGGRLDYMDTTRKPRPLMRSFTPVTLSLKDFRTTPEGGDFAFSARAQQAERIDWKGRIALAPTLSSQGEFTLVGVRLPELAEMAGEVLPFAISAGAAELAGSYRLSLGGSLSLEMQIPQLSLTGLGLRARGADVDWVQLPSLVVSDTGVVLQERSVSVGKVALAGLKVSSWLDANGSVNLHRLFVTPVQPLAIAPPAQAAPPASSTTPSAPVAARAPAAAAAPWSVRLASLELTDAAIDFEDRMQAPVKRFAVTPLNLRLTDASLDLSKPLKVALDATVNGRALIKVGGSLTPQPLAADLELSLQQASLQILQPYVAPFADLNIQDGVLSVDGKLLAAPPAAQGPAFSFAGDVAVKDFKSTDNARQQDLVNFRSLELQKLRYAHGPSSFSIDRILVTQPFARVSISREQVLNIAAVFAPRGAAAKGAAPKADPAGGGAVAATSGKAVPSAQPSKPTPKAEALPIRIREVRVAGGRMNFSDFSVQPNFAAEIFDLDGMVRGLSSAPDARAAVDLKGRVDEFSPVSISGTIQPFAYDQFTDIGLKFQNISLPVFNPYSGRFAGYNIAKGKLDTTLHYRVQQRKLTAAHKIRIDQLEWGEATNSQDAATLPVKFATSLLKDRNGVIDLDIPVSGTLDDPELRIGPIVWKIIGNLVVKVVSAPFALIGSLFADAQDAQFVDFRPGADSVDEDTAARLAALAKALAEKPELRLEVPIGTAPELDRPALADRRYAQERDAAVSKALGRKADAKTPMPAFDTLSPRQRLEVLTALVRQLGGVAPSQPASAASAPASPAAAVPVVDEEAAIKALEQQARGAIVVPDTELAALGQQRGAAVERALLTGTALQPERVFLNAAGSVSVQGDKVRFELAVK